jgi:dGTPase
VRAVNLRISQEEAEFRNLSACACKSAASKGREKQEEKCTIRTDFQRDRDRIIHCKAFRRLKHKTQVFISPEGDHYRTRLTHTLEVSQIARTIARALRLNEDLTEAIALGHDLGHTPFGHAGEKVLNEITPGGFEHNKQSLRVVERLEKDGDGLNLTWEVRDGILNHRSKGMPSTMEGMVVRLSDKIAYINHDIDDAVRAGVLKAEDIPRDIVQVLGSSSSKRLNAMITNVIENSIDKNEIVMSSDMSEIVSRLRAFMFKNVYLDERAKREGVKVDHMIKGLYGYYIEHTDEMEAEFIRLIESGEPKEKAVCDYIACMTDRYAIKMYTDRFIPSSWNIY